MKRALLGSLLAALFLVGCGGDDEQVVEGRGDVSGVVFDTDGNIVRDARVFYDGNNGGFARETVSNSAGEYTMTELPADANVGVFVSIRAEAEIDGVRCTGVNLGQVFSGDRTKNVNIGVFPTNRQASIYGSVYTTEGFKVREARVFARPRDGSILTSAVAVTNGNGNYSLNGLRSGIAYDIQVNAYGFSTDWLYNQTFTAGDRRLIDFQIGDTNDPDLPAPRNTYASAWTSPSEVTRDRELARAIDAIKNMVKPNRRNAVKTRDAINGYPIEVDVYWDKMTIDSLLGFGIYRSNNNQQTNVDFLRDPIAEFYADSDRRLQQNQEYTYEVSAINTNYSGGNGESPLSEPYTVRTLGAIDNETVDANLKFTWSAAVGAEKYNVYIFNTYPTVIPDTYFTSPSVTGTTYTYDGPNLGSGRYYYLIIGQANDGDSWTVSRVGSFNR